MLAMVLLGFAAEFLIFGGEDHLSPDDQPVFSISRPCGSGYQRFISLPQWLVFAVFVASIFAPIAWLTARIWRSVARKPKLRNRRRGFEVVFNGPPEQQASGQSTET